MVVTFTNSDLENVRKAIATGATSVSIDGRTVTYRSQDELVALASLIEKSIAAALDPETEVQANISRATFNKNYK